ncbi:hypothetical protein RIF29_41631 [Crotalaria pallida]|uniref:Uncharacterized protein n=1 Tax=Crotalaria pallida TaxID=3830 RepID=A0AAN9E6S1_CROPI
MLEAGVNSIRNTLNNVEPPICTKLSLLLVDSNYARKLKKLELDRRRRRVSKAKSKALISRIQLRLIITFFFYSQLQDNVWMDLVKMMIIYPCC